MTKFQRKGYEKAITPRVYQYRNLPDIGTPGTDGRRELARLWCFIGICEKTHAVRKGVLHVLVYLFKLK